MMPDLECFNNSRHYFIMGVGAFGLCTYSFGNASAPRPPASAPCDGAAEGVPPWE